MPKNKRPIESTRTSSRRQASKEALKQMQLLLDDEDDDAFVIQDDEEDKKNIRLEPPPPPPPKKRAISPIRESPPPKKKYKLSHRKSSDGNDRDVIVLKSISNSNYVPKENTLELECFVEELSEVQKERQRKAEYEEKELEAKLEELLKSKKAEVVYTGEMSSAVEVNELITNCGKKSIFKPNELPQLDETTPAFHLVMDPRLGLIVGTFSQTTNQVQAPAPTITKSKLQLSAAVKDVATIPQNTISTPGRNTRTRKGVIPTPTRANSLGVSTRGNATTPRSNNSTPTRGVPQVTTSVPAPSIQTRGMKSTPSIQTRNNKATPPPTTSKRPVVNVPVEKPSKQVVDLTSEENRNQADNREIAFNKLQGKTYPSLVVVARPHLRVTDLAVDRPKLDCKVKSVLMHPPTKFTEWLIQQGLIRAEQKCPVHGNAQLKLGMYSDVSKFPFSGGYVWISECCPQRFVSVFNGSIFEGSPHPPMVMLKLIYHWSCQTNIQNVTQWVKVDNLYVKGVYTWLRGVCTLAVQSRLRQLGGPGLKIEVGVISLGTTSHDGNQRQVKVEVLGVLETSTKYVRLRAVEPMPDGERNFRKKFSKILEPILHWVHPASTIITDLTVDKATLHHMGFANVIQTTSNEYNQSNRTIMEYLRRIVPRMFQNTLSLLSRQIIQQFLDELVWREWFGTTSQTAFDNIILHLADQTRTNPQTPLVLKLNKVAANPFRAWSSTTPSQVGANNVAAPASSTPTPAVATPVTVVRTPVAEVKKYGRGKKSNSPQVQVVQERPTKPVSPDVPEQMVPLENYYYGTIDPVNSSPAKVTLNMKCPFCKSSFDNNILLQNHLFKHAHNVSNDAYLCRYCLTSVSTTNELIHHVNKCHPGETKFDYGFVCLICEIHYMNPFVLGKHMSKEHIPHELPYQCGSCSFRCSNHKQVIDHFYLKHDGGSSIQCPFCLKSTTVWSAGRNVAQNIQYFIQHLQKHQKKQFAKRCGKCNLWFVQKDSLKEHQQKMHISLRGKVGLVPYPSPRNGVMVPKSKIDKNPCDAEVINFSSLYYNLSNNSVCKECNQAIASSKHFPSFDNCQNPNCQYSTCCAIAMMTHNAKCKGLNSVIPPETLPFEMFCVCGFKDSDGNSMAKHLAVCEKKSAYPSEAEAKSATVMHSMLDILGLVRKPEENKNEKPSDSCEALEKNENEESSSKNSNKESDSNEINVLSDEELVTKSIDPVKANKNTLELDSDIQISEKNLASRDRKEEKTELADDDNAIMAGKTSDIIDLDEEDAIMVEASSDETLKCPLNETNHIDHKTEEIRTDHLTAEKQEQDPMPETIISNTSNEDKQVNLHTIDEEDDISKGPIEMEVDQNEKHITETDENSAIEHDETDSKKDYVECEKENTEKCIVPDDSEADYTKKEMKLSQTEKEIVTDLIEEEETEGDKPEQEEVEADSTTKKESKTEDTEEKEEIISDCTEKKEAEDQIEKDEIEVENTAMEESETHNFEVDNTEKVNKGADNFLKECTEADAAEISNIESNDTDKGSTEEEQVAENSTMNEEIKADDDDEIEESGQSEKEMEVDHAVEETETIQKNTNEVIEPNDDEIKESGQSEKEMEVDLAIEETQTIQKHTNELIEANDDEKEIYHADEETDTIQKIPITNEVIGANDEIKESHQSEKNMEVEHAVKETENIHNEEDMKSNQIEKEFISDHTEKEISKGTDLELNETKIEKGEMQFKDEKHIQEIEKDHIPEVDITEKCDEDLIENCSTEDISTEKYSIEEKFNSYNTVTAEENPEILPTTDAKMKDDLINEEESSSKISEDNTHMNEPIDEIKSDCENIESISSKQSDEAEKIRSNVQLELCQPIEVKDSEANNQTDEAMDYSEISSTCLDKNEISDVMDNAELVDSGPYIQSENEDIIKNILPTSDVMPMDVNSTNMDVD